MIIQFNEFQIHLLFLVSKLQSAINKPSPQFIVLPLFHRLLPIFNSSIKCKKKKALKHVPLSSLVTARIMHKESQKYTVGKRSGEISKSHTPSRWVNLSRLYLPFQTKIGVLSVTKANISIILNSG